MHRRRIEAIGALQQYIRNWRQVLCDRGVRWTPANVPFTGVLRQLQRFAVDLVANRYPAPETAAIAMGILMPVDEIVGDVAFESEQLGHPIDEHIGGVLVALYHVASPLNFGRTDTHEARSQAEK